LRRPNEELINAVHQIYADVGERETAPTLAAVRRTLEQRGLGRRAPNTVRYWRDTLRRRGFLDREDRVLVLPIWPTYLLIDVPLAAAAEVVRRLRAHDPAIRLERTHGIYSLVAKTFVRQPTALDELVARCLGAGAVDATAILVLREAV